MKNAFKITLITISTLVILLGTITAAEQLMQKKETLSTDADFDFVAWSNSISEEEAKAQLKDFLSSNFDSWEEAEAWLIAQGLEVKSALLSENSTRIYGINNPAFSVAAYWNTEKQGIIFAHGWLLNLESKILVHSVSIEILYTEIERIIIHDLRIIKTRL